MVAELWKGVHCVDLGESFQTHIYLQNVASIKPRTSPVKFARSLAVQQPSQVPIRGLLALEVRRRGRPADRREGPGRVDERLVDAVALTRSAASSNGCSAQCK